jgi:hypothetical protein
MRDWNKQTDRLECLRVDQSLITWRIHTAKLSGIRVLAGTGSTFLGKQGCIERLAVTANYEETVKGYIQWTTDSHRQPDEQPTKNYYDSLQQNFTSTALVLRLENQPTDSNALPSLCQVMRYVLPVHLGVEEDALEVITLDGEKINGEQRSYGIAIVDLYPNGGIGLINAIYDDNTLLRKLLGWARDWLNESPDDILNTPMCLAANPDVLPQKQSALDLLNQLID